MHFYSMNIPGIESYDPSKPYAEVLEDFKATGKLTDQNLLGKIALEDTDSDVRRAATKKLTDQTLLGKIALEDTDSDVRRAATEKLKE